MDYVIEVSSLESEGPDFSAKRCGGVVAIVPVGPSITQNELYAIWRCLCIQTVRPDLVVFVFDRSDLRIPRIDVSEGVRYTVARCKDNKHNVPGCVRNVGLSVVMSSVHRGLLSLPWAVFSPDADDMIAPDYVEKCLAALEADCRNGVAYGTIYELRGQRASIVQEKSDLGRENWIQSGCMYRFEALIQVGGWHELSETDDWMTLRRIRDNGWHFVKADTAYYWCPKMGGTHARAVFKTEQPWGYCVRNADRLITVAVPIVRAEYAAEIADFVSQMEVPGRRNVLLIYDNTADIEAQKAVSQAVARLCERDEILENEKFDEIRLVRDRTLALMSGKVSNFEVARKRQSYEMAVNFRVGGLWNRIFQTVDTDFVFCLEDDVRPDRDTLMRLFDRMSVDVDGVSAAYRDRTGAWCCWRADEKSGSFEMIQAASTGAQEVDGFGLGCALLRRSVVSSVPFQGVGNGIFGAYDVGRWCIHRRTGGFRLLVDWDTKVRHLSAEGERWKSDT